MSTRRPALTRFTCWSKAKPGSLRGQGLSSSVTQWGPSIAERVGPKNSRAGSAGAQTRDEDKAILPESTEQSPEQDLENLRQSTATGGKHPQGLLLGGQPGKTQLVGAEPRLPRREAAAAGLGAGVANAWVTAGGAWVPAQRRVRGGGGSLTANRGGPTQLG